MEVRDYYAAQAARADKRAERADSPVVADSWRALAETYRLLAGHYAKNGKHPSTHPTRKSEDEATSEDGFPRPIW